MRPLFLLWFVLLTAWHLLAQPNQRPRLTADETITGTFNGDVSAQLYSFNARKGDFFSVEMTATDDTLDAFLILLDATGTVIAVNDDRDANTLNAALVDVEIPITGGYLLLATTFESLDEFLKFAPPAPLTYTLTASGFTDEGEAPPPLEATALTFGEPIEVESTAMRPVAYFTFDAIRGDVVDIIARRIAGIDPVLHVFGPDGARLAFDDDDDTSRTFTVDAAVYSLEIPADGRYLVLASDTFFYNALTPDATLRYSPGTLSVEVRRTPAPLSPGK
jgi:hypothetical protein